MSADELSKLNFEDDLAEVRIAEDALRWSIDRRGELEVAVTMSPREHDGDVYVARLLWLSYPGSEPPSVKFIDPSTGRMDLPTAWPKARGFRPDSLDVCANWSKEGLITHPEWVTDARYRWKSDRNVMLKSLRTIQGELDDTYEGRFK